MEATPDGHRILVCLTPDASQSEGALTEAERLARTLNASVTVVQVYPESWRGPLKPHSSAWQLRSDDPIEALRRFAARNRITHIVC